MAVRAFFGKRGVGNGVFAVGIFAAAVKQAAEAGFALGQVAFFTLRAGNAGVFGLFFGLDVFAFGVVAAADEFAETAFAVHELAAALGAASAFEFGLLGGVLGDALGGLLGGFADVAGVVAFGVAGAGDEAAAFAEFDLKLVLAAFGAGFVECFGGDFGALDAFFFLDLLVETLPEFVHHRYPLALAAGDVVELVFKLGGEVVIDVLLEVFG